MNPIHRLYVLLILLFAVTQGTARADNNDPVVIYSILREAGCPLNKDQHMAFFGIKLDQHMRHIVIALDSLFTDTQKQVLIRRFGSIPDSRRAEWDRLGICNLFQVYVLERKNIPVTELQLSHMPQMTTPDTEQSDRLERYFTPEQANALRYYMDSRQR